MLSQKNRGSSYPDFIIFYVTHGPVLSFRMRLLPAGPHSERVAIRDDVIPLRTPVRASNGKLLDSITVRKGQVRNLKHKAGVNAI